MIFIDKKALRQSHRSQKSSPAPDRFAHLIVEDPRPDQTMYELRLRTSGEVRILAVFNAKDLEDARAIASSMVSVSKYRGSEGKMSLCDGKHLVAL